MKKIIPLIFSVLYVITSNAQAIGGWGTCEFATVATMNAFDPSINAYDCKKVFVQATNEHYYWNGTIWVLDADTDNQNASEVPFTPVGTIVATDVQAAIAEIEPDIYGSIDVHSDVDITTIAPSSGDLLEWDGSNFVPVATDNGYTVFNIFAEESASLELAGAREWSFGNGDNTPTGHGIVIPVDCELFAMSLDHEGGVNTTVRIIKNSDVSLSTYQVTNTATENGYATFGTPLSFSAGDIVNFNTISATVVGTSGRVSAWFRIRATPASNSLVNDMLDVSAGAIASGDILYYDGASFLPLTLEAVNIPYDNSISSLTATDVQAAIDELASGGSSDNIYNTDGTIDANREVSLGNFDIEFNSTGTGDFHVSDNGTIVFSIEDDNVGIGIAAPLNPLHIYETTGTPASATNGTIFIEKGNSGGSQSIVFESNVAAGSDYAYIEYSDDGSGNGSTAENSLLVIGIGDDGLGVNQDDIAIMPSGNLGVGTTTPAARFDVDGGTVKFSDYGIGANTGTTTYILAVDADGDIIEVDPSTLMDNLGNHVAEENIQMTDYWISNDGDDEGIFIDNSGNVGIGTDTPNGALEVSGGKVIFSDYGLGTMTGTIAYYLAVDNTGAVIEVVSPSNIRKINTTTITFDGTDEDDWSPTGLTSAPFYQVYRINCTNNTVLTGINSSGVADGQIITLLNVGTNDRIEIKDEDTASSAANRIIGPGNGNINIDKGDSITLIYDATSSRWRTYSVAK